MKSFTVRLPDALVADIEAESRVRSVSRSDVIRERLEEASLRGARKAASWEAVAHVVGSVDGLPADLSGRKKAYLDETGYGPILLTTDKDFRVYRRNGRQIMPCVAPF